MKAQSQRYALVVACAIACTVLSGSGPKAQTGTASAPPQQQPPAFRTAINFVQVDVYPTKDGTIVEGLSAKDFQVLEDGKPQAVESFEFIRIEPNTPEAMRRDPNTQDEGNRLAADPRNRVFVLFLDHYHASLSGSRSIIQPVVAMLNRLLTAGDLFGVATAVMRPRDLILGRQTTTIEDQLTRNWTWGLQSGAIALDPEEQELVKCYGQAVAVEISERLREEKTIRSLMDWVGYLGRLREARKAMIVFGIGWNLYRPDLGRLNVLLDLNHFASRPLVGVTQAGTLSTTPGDPAMASWTKCGEMASRAFQVDDERKFRDLIDEANRYNVAFYPVNVDGLSLGGRADTLRTLAENTDGVISNTNDFSAALRRVSDDVSAYYLMGYSSTNTRQDGTFRKIEVKTTSPGLRVKARRGYFAPTPETRSMSNAPPKSEAASAVALALTTLSRLRPSAELFTYGVPTPTELAVVVELPGSAVIDSPWSRGADVQISPGAPAAPVTARIEAGQRSVLVRLPKPEGPGPYRLTVRLTGSGTALTERMEIAESRSTVVGEPLIFRATPAAQSPLRPAADAQFYRTERLHVEWPILLPIDQRTARLLGRDGRALAVPVNLTERDQAGQRVIAADLNLAPLAPGDYVVELVVGAGASEARRYLPLRVR